MKKAFIFVPVIVLVMGCGGGTNSKYKVPITSLSGETVYDEDGNAADISGQVAVMDDRSPVIELGTVENGTLNLEFPELSDPRFNNLYTQKGFELPGITIEPSDARWVFIGDIYVFPDTGNERYELEVSGSPSAEIQLVYFAKDTAIKGKNNFLGVEWDIDIRARKGWNMLYAVRSETTIRYDGIGENAGDITWTASALSPLVSEDWNQEWFGAITED
jgi:hypothetical protein